MKYRINVNERTEFNHSIIIKSDASNIYTVLDNAEGQESLEDTIYSLKENGCKVLKVDRDESGSNVGIEIDDMNEIKEGK